MADGNPQSDDRLEIDLAAERFDCLFTEAALRSSTHLNFYRDGQIALHVKYLPHRGAFVLNDFIDGRWGQEVHVECLMTPGGSGVRMSLAWLEQGPELRLRGAQPLNLAERFDVSGKLLVQIPAPILREAPEETGPQGSRRLGIQAPPAKVRTIDAAGLQMGVDATVTSDAAFFIEGWIDDRRSRLVGLSLVDYATGLRANLPVGRVRRPDVDSHLQASRPGEFGFWAVGLGGASLLEGSALSFVFEDGTAVPLQPGARFQKDERDFFEFLLAHFGRRMVLGNLTARSFDELERGHGELLLRLYRHIAAQRAVTSHGRFGRQASPPRLSLVCVLFGVPDFLYHLVAQFARFGGLEGLEFIFVNNSPEMEEVLLRDAELAAFVFGADIQVITLNQNSGFSHANNVGAAAARSARLVIINPDVFPRSAEAVARLRGYADRPLGADIYGGKLYYADGSVMHEDMFFRQDRRLSLLCDAPIWTVEHFRKGFADTSDPAPREVPAVTGALMVMETTLFERLGGFNVDFIFGHYEDADFCLRAQAAGGRVILDPALAYWHYEGMGSTKRPEHLGSNLYNRWYFSRLWGRRITEHEHG